MALAGLGSLAAMLAAMLVTLLVDPNAPHKLKEGFRIPPDDRPIGERQLLAWLLRPLRGRNWTGLPLANSGRVTAAAPPRPARTGAGWWRDRRVRR